LPFDKIQELEGFGQKSVENLSQSIENSRTIQDFKFLAGLGIDGVGVEVAKLICQKLES
jgi:DNA ligase (NAD+)